MKELKVGDICYYIGVKHIVTSVIAEDKMEGASIKTYIIAPFFISGKIAYKYSIKVNSENPFLKSSEDYANDRATKIAMRLALDSFYGKDSTDTKQKLKELQDAFNALSKENEKLWKLVFKNHEEYKALIDIIRTLFKDRCKLYERTAYIETCNKEGCHAKKVATTSYILEFHNNDLHYEFHLHKDEFDRLKEVLL